jgi:enamine deaminase RidA (YjgF/YER057c/UK114 family)
MEKAYLNPPGIFKHPAFTRVISVKGPMRIVFVAGQTPSDETYQPVAKGDMRAQYIKVMQSLEAQLKAAGATWDDVVYKRIFVLDVDEYIKATRGPNAAPTFGDPARQPPSTMVGVTRLSNPDFLVEIDLMAVCPE